MQEINCDLIIVGAGPAGGTMALFMAGSGLRVTIIDKERFPRPKICGDALSGKVVSILKRMPGGISEEFHATVPKTPSYGIRYVSPNGRILDLPFKPSGDIPPGFICPRESFDGFLVSSIRKFPEIRLIEGEKVVEVKRHDDLVTAFTDQFRISGRMIAGADGTHSVVRTLPGVQKPLRKNLSTGIRAYFEGVTGFHPKNYIELIYLKELLPFYFWIFPEVNGRCNAGLAMMQTRISQKKINLGAVFDELIRNHPLISPRFAGARMTGRAEACALPLGMPPGPFSGDRFLLLGDAASLVDPFTGEGIGNAMASGEVAARVVKKCFGNGNLSAAGLCEYDIQLKHRIGGEFKGHSLLHKMAGSAFLLNTVIWFGGVL